MLAHWVGRRNAVSGSAGRSPDPGLSKGLPFCSTLGRNKLGYRLVGSFNHHHKRINVNGTDCPLERRWMDDNGTRRIVRIGLGAVGMELLSQGADVKMEMIFAAVDVLAEIDSPRAKMGEHLLKRCDLLMDKVAAVIDNHIKRWNFGTHALPKSSICLIPDQNGDSLSFIDAAGRFDVHTEDTAAIAEIGTPHVEAAAAIDADFENVDWFADKLGKMAIIDVKVVLPLPQTWPCRDAFRIAS